MKSKSVLLASAFLISGVTFAQKDELKDFKKIYEKEILKVKDVSDYKATVAKAEPLIASASEADKVYLNFYKSSVPFIEMSEAMTKPENQANPKNAYALFTPAKISSLAENAAAVLDYEKKSGKQVLSKTIQKNIDKAKPILVNYAVSLGDDKRFKDGASVLQSIYILDKNDPEKLYYAANYAINGQDYDQALKYYQELKAINFSGEKTNYYAKSKVNDNEDYFDSKASRDNVIKLGTHFSPRDEKEPSKRGEIYKNIALIYNSKGDIASAKKAIADARVANPEDTSLIMTEANLALQTNDKETYKKLISQVIEKNPNDADLFYNLGVIAAEAKESTEAEKYYKKAIELKPDFVNAYLNIAHLKLGVDQDLVAQMNKLGTSAKDNKKYDELKVTRQNVFKSSLSYLEKANQLDPKNQDVQSTLLNVYNYLEMTAEAKALKAKSGR